MQSIQSLKVVELASVLAGPAVGMFFAELGAHVIKVENAATGGDVTRGWKLPTEQKENPVSGYYCSVNWNKETHFLDLQDPSAQEQVHQWIKEADIVIANYKASSAQKLRMDANYLHSLNPKLIYGNISGFGDEDDRVAFDVVLQAEAGFMYMNGESDGPPVKMPVALIDVLAAHQLKEGILLALLERSITGKGAVVSVSLLEAAVSSLVNQATNWLMGGHIPERMGSLHPNIAPYGEIFNTKDNKQVVVAAGSEGQFKALCKCLGNASLSDQFIFANNLNRVRNRQALQIELQRLFSLWNANDILPLCHQNFVPIGSIRNMKEVFENEKAMQMVLKDTNPDGSENKRVRSTAFHFKSI